MASNRQVRDWIVECLKLHLAPDALGVSACYGDNLLSVYTRKPGTEDEHGRTVTVTVGDDDKLKALKTFGEVEAEKDAIGKERDRWKGQCDVWRKLALGCGRECNALRAQLAEALQNIQDQAEVIERYEARK